MKVCVFNCQQAKKVDLVDYLPSVGCKPKRIRVTDHWYKSPFRDEKEASFKVDRGCNIWYDHGSGKGGNIIDFVMQFHQCPSRPALWLLKNFFLFHQSTPPHRDTPAADPVPEKRRIRILDAYGIRNENLIGYLQQRRIDLHIAAEHCQEVLYQVNGKIYTALAYSNRSGGYELRNEFFKGSSSPKDISLIERSTSRIAVFEGFFDLLSYLTIPSRSGPAPDKFSGLK